MQGFLIFGSAAVLIIILGFIDYYAQDFLSEQEKTKHEERKPITMKIKTFEFEVCNWSELATDQDTRSIDYRQAQERIATPEKIDETINEFYKNKNVINHGKAIYKFAKIVSICICKEIEPRLFATDTKGVESIFRKALYSSYLMHKITKRKGDRKHK